MKTSSIEEVETSIPNIPKFLSEKQMVIKVHIKNCLRSCIKRGSNMLITRNAKHAIERKSRQGGM